MEHYRTVWISDLHLGTRDCDAAGLLDFLKHHEFEKLYLVGDVIDIWRLKRDHYWPQSHNDVVQKILRKARRGARVVFIPGNHDEFCRNFLGFYGNIAVKLEDVHTTQRGQRLLVLHGHEFDAVIMHAKWLAYLGDAGYYLLLRLNRPLNFLRRQFGFGSWSLSAYVKRNMKKVINTISQFEEAVTHYTKDRALDGVVCGHIHTPEIRRRRDFAYYNAGDWVESSSALVEHLNGLLELIHWRAKTAVEENRLPEMSRPIEVANDLMAASLSLHPATRLKSVSNAWRLSPSRNQPAAQPTQTGVRLRHHDTGDTAQTAYFDRGR
ncbi:MAG: UDP-2,3-diacylglucosamine diphosphatase [Verrucomicrobiia bacterium]